MLRLYDNEKKAGAVYVSWATFKNALDQLSQAVPPNKVDRSVFPGIAWAIQNQLFTGMRFLGLIDQESKPTVELEQLARPDEAARKKKLSEILHQRYSDLFALDLKKTTPAELEQKMGEAYHISGDTRDKAVRFFLSAAEYAGIELSTYFSTKKANGQPAAKRVKTRRPKTTVTQPPGDSSPAMTAGTSKTTVQLKSGGSLSVSVTVDLFVLDSNDRRFVFELIDKLEEYEKSANTETPDSVAALSGER
jgi:hypothetical protein